MNKMVIFITYVPSRLEWLGSRKISTQAILPKKLIERIRRHGILQYFAQPCIYIYTCTGFLEYRRKEDVEEIKRAEIVADIKRRIGGLYGIDREEHTK